MNSGNVVKDFKQSKSLTIKEALDFAATSLLAASPSFAHQEAELLLQKILNKTRTQLFIDGSQLVGSRKIYLLHESLNQRLRGVPIQQIIGKQAFRYIDIEVNPYVFIPRPETELLVEHVIEATCELESITFVDIGTGCGAIAISLTYEVDASFGYAIDISHYALKLAQKNARAWGVFEKLAFIQSDLLKNLDSSLAGKIDLIVSNPPYISKQELPGLPAEVRFHEPKEALDGGEDGLKYYRQIIGKSPQYLKTEGWLAFEIGLGQKSKVIELLEKSGDFNEIHINKDFAGIDRVILARRK